MLNPSISTGSADPWVGITQTSDSAPGALSDTCALLALMVHNQSANQAGSKTDVQLDFEKMKELKKELADAMERAKEAAEHSSFFGFLGKVFGSDIAQIAGAVAAVAAVVATGGAAAPLILVAVSAALEEGAKLGPKLGIDPKICLAISLVGAAVGLCSGVGSAQATGTVVTVAKGVKVGAECVEQGGVATGAVLGYVSQHYESQKLGFQADATGYQAQDDATNMDLDTAIALIRQSLQTEQRETSTVSAIIQNNYQANTAISERI
jgi:hypothetical protein